MIRSIIILTIVVLLAISMCSATNTVSDEELLRVRYDSTLTRQADKIDSLFSCLIVDGKVSSKDMERFCAEVERFVYLKMCFDVNLKDFNLRTWTVGPLSSDDSKSSLFHDKWFSQRQIAVAYQMPLIVHGSKFADKIAASIEQKTMSSIKIEQNYQVGVILILMVTIIGSAIVAFFTKPYFAKPLLQVLCLLIFGFSLIILIVGFAGII